jgi:hypothetical protein
VGLRPRLPALDRAVPQGRPEGPAASCSSSTSPAEDLEIPGEPYTFATLIRAQADGDLQTLRNHGLPAVRISVGDIDAIKEQL